MIEHTGSRERSELRTHWRVLLAATMGMPTLAFFSIGIFSPILSETFNWSFGSIMGGLALTSIVILFCGPLIGRHIVHKIAPESRGIITLALKWKTIIFPFSQSNIISPTADGKLTKV